ncbi:TRAP transporter permease [bacterium]|nr:MAG: TRAP transporter permease [bacterium]
MNEEIKRGPIQSIYSSLKNNPSESIRNILIAVIGLFIALFHLYSNSWWAFFSAHVPRILHVTCLAAMAFLIYRSSKKKNVWWANFIDYSLFAAVAGSGIYMLLAWQDIVLSGGYYSDTDAIVSIILVLLILEMTRRSISAFLSVIAALFIAYALWGHHLPGFFSHREYDVYRVFAFLCTTPEAVFGIPIGVSSTYMIMFIIFGALLNVLGGSDFFIDLAFSMTGRLRGGAAKAAVVASAMVGTISGSSTANVVTTGTFTIPLMKRAGYKPSFAGAVEAVASTGGQITPPIMGAAAFLMCELTNTPYITVAISALIPAFLYFFATFVIVDLEAKKLGMTATKSEDLPKVITVMKERGYLIVPLFTLFGFIIYGYSPMRAVFLSLLVLIALSFLGKSTRPGALTIPKALIQAARNTIPVASACASAGIIMGIINLTGIGVKFSALITEYAKTNLLLGLIFTMIACIILGCGMPTTAVYIIVAVLAAPSLIDAGVPPLIAHMFIFYYGCTAPITPPVAMSSYAAAAIAEADPMKVSWDSVRIGFVIFVIPYLLVYFPELMMIGTLFQIILAIGTATIAIVLLSAALSGIFITHCFWWERILFLLAGAFLFVPGWKTDLFGLLLGVLVIICQIFIQHPKVKVDLIKYSNGKLSL